MPLLDGLAAQLTDDHARDAARPQHEGSAGRAAAASAVE
jgi:hypothetical protein